MTDQPDNQQVVLAQPSMRLPMEIAGEYKINIDQWRVLVDQLFPAAKSAESIAMALAYCRARNLDIFKRPVHIVPMYSAVLKKMVETVWPGIAEVRTTASRTGIYAGIDAVEYGPMKERTFKGEKDKWEGRNKTGTEKFEKVVRYPEWASVVVYKVVGGVRCPYHAKIYWEETYATVGKTDVPNDMWAKRPHGQLDKCVEAAALRKAFPEELGNEYVAEEMEGKEMIEEIRRDAPVAPTPPTPPKKEAAPKPPKPAEKPVDNAEKNTRGDEQADERSMVNTSNPFEDNVEDAVTEEIVEERQPFDVTKALDGLEADLASAMDETTVEEIWNHHDMLAKLEGTSNASIDMAIANRLKGRALERVSKAKK